MGREIKLKKIKNIQVFDKVAAFVQSVQDAQKDAAPAEEAPAS